MQTTTRYTLAGALALAALAIDCQAQGVKAPVTIALTITEPVGGFFVKDSQLEAEEGRNVTYDNPVNPMDFEPDQAAANNYSYKNAKKYRAKDFETGEPFDETEDAQSWVVKNVATRFDNARFLTDLVKRGTIPANDLTPAQAIKGYSLVAVQIISAEEGAPWYLFADKAGTTPILIGAINASGLSDLPILGTFKNGSVASTESEVTKTSYSYTPPDPEFPEDGPTWEAGEPRVTSSRSISAIEDMELSISRSDQARMDLRGLFRYGAKTTATSEGSLIPGACTSNLSGSFLEGQAVVSGTLNIGAPKNAADLDRYTNAIPAP